MSARLYCAKFKKCYGNTCLKPLSNGRVKRRCISKRIDGVYFWNNKLRRFCRNVCKS